MATGIVDQLKACLPDIPLDGMKKVTAAGEYAGPCPFPGCDSDDDGFFVRADKSFMCRKCGVQGDKLD